MDIAIIVVEILAIAGLIVAISFLKKDKKKYLEEAENQAKENLVKELDNSLKNKRRG